MWHCLSHYLGDLLTPHASFAQSPSEASSSNHVTMIYKTPPNVAPIYVSSLPQFSPLVTLLQPYWSPDFSWNMPGTVRPQRFSLCLEFFSPDNLIISSFFFFFPGICSEVTFLEQASNFTSFYQTLVLLLATQRPTLMRANVGRQENCF